VQAWFDALFWGVMAVAMVLLLWRAGDNLVHALRARNWRALLWSLVAAVVALLAIRFFLLLSMTN